MNCGRCWFLTEFQIVACRVILVMLCMMVRRKGLCSIYVHVKK